MDREPQAYASFDASSGATAHRVVGAIGGVDVVQVGGVTVGVWIHNGRWDGGATVAKSFDRWHAWCRIGQGLIHRCYGAVNCSRDSPTNLTFDERRECNKTTFYINGSGENKSFVL